MKKYDYILFDMDGTLVDTGEGVKTSFLYALGKYGITAEMSELDGIMGPPLYDSFRRFFGFGDEQAREAVGHYRSNYREKGIYMDRLYDGMKQTLDALASEGSLLAVATSKPRPFAETVLARHGLTSLFTVVVGSEFDGTRATKNEVIEYALAQLEYDSSHTAVMVGDRSYDITGGKKFGLDTVGVLFGYGSRSELEEAGADCIAADCDALLDALTRR